MTFTIPNIFIAGKKAVAHDVNENFDAVKNELIKQGESLAKNTETIDETKKYVEGDLKKELTNLIRIFDSNFCANSGFVDENGQNNSLYQPDAPVIATKSLPTFKNATEAKDGKNGVKISPSGVYNIIGRNTALSRGYDVDRSQSYWITVTFDTPVKVTGFTFIGGGIANQAWDSVLSIIQASNDGSSWTELRRLNSLGSHINESLLNDDRFSIYRLYVQPPSTLIGTSPHTLGAVNLFYEDIVDPGDSKLILRANEDTPFIYTLAKGKNHTLENNLTTDLSQNFLNHTGGLNIFINNGQLEAYANKIYRQDAQPKSPQKDDIWFRTYEPFSSFKYSDDEWGVYTGVPLGYTTLANGVVTKIENFPYNQNGYNVNARTKDWRNLYVDYSKGISYPAGSSSNPNIAEFYGEAVIVTNEAVSSVSLIYVRENRQSSYISVGETARNGQGNSGNTTARVRLSKGNEWYVTQHSRTIFYPSKGEV